MLSTHDGHESYINKYKKENKMEIGWLYIRWTKYLSESETLAWLIAFKILIVAFLLGSVTRDRWSILVDVLGQVKTSNEW